MDKLLKVGVLVSVLCISLSISYYYVIFLPGLQTDREVKAKARQTRYDECTNKVEQNYTLQIVEWCKSFTQAASETTPVLNTEEGRARVMSECLDVQAKNKSEDLKTCRQKYLDEKDSGL